MPLHPEKSRLFAPASFGAFELKHRYERPQTPLNLYWNFV
jgi:hypothetical protein